MLIDATFHLIEMQLRGPEVIRRHREGAKLHPGVVIAAHGVHGFQERFCFFRDLVELLIVGQRGKIVARFHRAALQVHEAELEMHGGVEEIEEIAPFVQHGQLFVVVGKLIIDIVILNGFGKMGIVHLTDAVRIHLLVGNGFLGCAGAMAFLPHFGDGFIQPLPLGAGQLYFLFFLTPGCFRLFSFFEQTPEQWLSPPCRNPPACAGQYKDCWS